MQRASVTLAVLLHLCAALQDVQAAPWLSDSLPGMPAVRSLNAGALPQPGLVQHVSGRQLQGLPPNLTMTGVPYTFGDTKVDPTINDTVVPAKGSWKVVGSSGIIGIHAHLFPNNKVLFVERPLNLSADSFENQPPGQHWRIGSIYDLAANQASLFYIQYGAYCGSFSALPNGDLLMAGGDLAYGLGVLDGHFTVQVLPMATVTNNAPVPTVLDLMWRGRWYPSTLAMPSGAVLIVGGTEGYGTQYGAPIVGNNEHSYQMWYPDPVSGNYSLYNLTYIDVLLADYPNNLYPLLFLLPKTGNVVICGGHAFAAYSVAGPYLTLLKTTAYTIPNLAVNPLYPQTGTGVMLELNPATNYLAKIAVIGGTTIDYPNVTADGSDLIHLLTMDGVTTPSWQSIQMPIARVMPNSALLHDGTVFIGNGARNGVAGAINQSEGYASNPSTAPVIWNPSTNSFALMADSKIPRMYHSTMMKMPSGLVMVAGFEIGHEYRVQMFTPPYFLNGQPQPMISSVPTLVYYNHPFAVGWSGAASIIKVVLYRAGTTTHSTNHDQRQIVCSFSSVGANMLTVLAPPDITVAPPGYYQLILGSNQGVPSAGSWMQVMPVPPTLAPTLAPTAGPTPAPTSAPTPMPTPVPTPEPTSAPAPSITYQLYLFKSSPSTFPNYTALNPNYTATLATIDYSSNGTKLPGPSAGKVAPSSNFATRFTAQLVIPKVGSYTFSLLSDDGAKLLLNGVPVITRKAWSTTPTLYMTAFNTTGAIAFEVDHIQAGGPYALRLQWLTPGASAQVDIPMAAFRPVVSQQTLTATLTS